jgi:hypothetical protein
MPAIGFGIVWAGYTLGLWGYCLIRGYDVTLGELANPVHILNWARATQSTVPPGQMMPSSAKAGTAGKSGPPPQTAV